MSDSEENQSENEDRVEESVVSEEGAAESSVADEGGIRPEPSDTARKIEDSDEPEDYDPMAAISEKKEEAAKKAEAEKTVKNKVPKGDEFSKTVKQSRVQAEKKRQLKKKVILGVVAGFVLFLVAAYTYLMTPYKGGMTYGICKVFLERKVTFPSTLELKGVEDFGNSVRIWYMTIDSFGNNRMEPIQCYFKTDATSGYLQIDKVKIRRRDVDQNIVDDFNKTIPALYAYPPDLSLPYTSTDTLQNLHYEVNQYRKPIF